MLVSGGMRKRNKLIAKEFNLLVAVGGRVVTETISCASINSPYLLTLGAKGQLITLFERTKSSPQEVQRIQRIHTYIHTYIYEHIFART